MKKHWFIRDEKKSLCQRIDKRLPHAKSVANTRDELDCKLCERALAKIEKQKDAAEFECHFVLVNPCEAEARLAQKKLNVMRGIERLAKTGVYVDGDGKDGFCFATSAVVVSEFRKLFIEQRLAPLVMVDCEIVRLTQAKTAVGFTSWLYTIKCTFKLTDVETGYSEVSCAFGQGESTGAFSIAAAQTVARRVWLLNTFLVETYDDPEASRELKGKIDGKMETPGKDELQKKLVDQLYEHFMTVTDGKVLRVALELEIYRVLGGRWPAGEMDIDTVKAGVGPEDIAPGFKKSNKEQLEAEMDEATEKVLKDKVKAETKPTKGDAFDKMFVDEPEKKGKKNKK